MAGTKTKKTSKQGEEAKSLSDADREAAWKRIRHAAKSLAAELSEKSWRRSGTPEQATVTKKKNKKKGKKKGKKGKKN